MGEKKQNEKPNQNQNKSNKQKPTTKTMTGKKKKHHTQTCQSPEYLVIISIFHVLFIAQNLPKSIW